MRLTKKALLLLRLPEKYSFTLSKLRFFGLCKPKNSSFYPTSLQTWVTHFTFGSPTNFIKPSQARMQNPPLHLNLPKRGIIFAETRKATIL